jgi:polysaccharide export outer membrane protein
MSAMRSAAIVVSLLATGLTACTTAMQAPHNFHDSGRGATPYMQERRPFDASIELAAAEVSALNQGTCRLPSTGQLTQDAAFTPVNPTTARDLPLSPGDMVRLTIEDDELLSGNYVLSPAGRLAIPYLPAVQAAGFRASDLEAMIAAMLVAEQLYQASALRVSLQVVDYGPVQVFVSGAVFQEGMTTINARKAADQSPERQRTPGDAPAGRRLSTALRSAAGVRPDADLANVILTRGGRRRILDLRGAIEGAPFDDLMLIAGDQIHVQSRECFQPALVRPSAVTPPGIRVFMSNLTRPAPSNALSAISRDAWSLPYGTRLLQGLVSANCVGGTKATNANRFAVLISRNPITGQSEVISRPVEALVRRADRDGFDPYLMPGDAIACYDSAITNFGDVVDLLADGAMGATIAGTVIR